MSVGLVTAAVSDPHVGKHTASDEVGPVTMEQLRGSYAVTPAL